MKSEAIGATGWFNARHVIPFLHTKKHENSHKKWGYMSNNSPLMRHNDPWWGIIVLHSLSGPINHWWGIIHSWWTSNHQWYIPNLVSYTSYEIWYTPYIRPHIPLMSYDTPMISPHKPPLEHDTYPLRCGTHLKRPDSDLIRILIPLVMFDIRLINSY